MSLNVKICGITTAESAQVSADAGAKYLGFVFFDKSPRNLTMQAARILGPQLPIGPDRVGVFVNAEPATIYDAVKALSLNWIQLHGSESAEYIENLKQQIDCKIIKAFSISDADDLQKTALYRDHVDAYLFDAKPPKGAILPGGNNISFPWEILKGHTIDKMWFLAGGISKENLSEAALISGAKQVDISSSVESAPGKKDHEKIQAFLDVAAKI